MVQDNSFSGHYQRSECYSTSPPIPALAYSLSLLSEFVRIFRIPLTLLQKWRKEYQDCEAELNTLLSTRNTTTATLLLLNSIHAAFVLSSEIEKALMKGQVDVAYNQLQILESTVKAIRERNNGLVVTGLLEERTGVLRDVLGVETEKVWSQLVGFSEEGDIQLTIRKSHRTYSIPVSRSPRS